MPGKSSSKELLFEDKGRFPFIILDYSETNFFSAPIGDWAKAVGNSATIVQGVFKNDKLEARKQQNAKDQHDKPISGYLYKKNNITWKKIRENILESIRKIEKDGTLDNMEIADTDDEEIKTPKKKTDNSKEIKELKNKLKD